MNNLSYQHIILCFFFASGGTVGGWALTGKLAGEDAAFSFLSVGIAAVLMMLIAQLMLYSLGRRRLIYRLLFNIAFACGIVWFVLCLLLPVLWVSSVSGTDKFILFSFLAALCASNISRAGRQFREKWGQTQNMLWLKITT